MFLVFFIIWWRTVFIGRPADNHTECRNMALSLKGWTSSFQRKILLMLGDGKHEAADLLNQALQQKLVTFMYVTLILAMHVMAEHQIRRDVNHLEFMF